MTVKSKEQARANFESAIPMIPTRYAAGVKAADWQTPAGSDQSESNYASQVQKAIAAKKRQAAVKKVSNIDWQQAAATKGSAVIADRLTGALAKWSTNWGPMYDAVVSRIATLPPRTVDFRQNVTARLLPVVEQWKKSSGKL